jgi:glycosyltransferase involved in cell wall biosynthesis
VTRPEAVSGPRMRILYVHSSLVPPPKDLRTDRFFLLSEKLEGDVLHPIWFRTPEQVEAEFGPGSYPVHTVGNFRYHWFLASATGGAAHKLARFLAYLRKGVQLHRERRFDCIVAYSHMTTGLLAGIIKLLTGAKLIIEIATTPHLVYITEKQHPGLRERIMKAYSDLCLHLSMWMADRAHLLSSDQLSAYPSLRRVRSSVFHEFVAVSVIDRPCSHKAGECYVLLVGAPWYLKGVDVLIKAFHSLAEEFPGLKLKLLGHFPDRHEFESLLADSPRIEVLKARPNPEVLPIITGATVLVLPSRCEGMGRVLLEAMAAGVPLIGSNVGGIPTMIHDGENGFLAPVGDSRTLAVQLRKLLQDSELRRRMGDCGYARAHEQLNEKVYVEQFARMVEAAVEGRA